MSEALQHAKDCNRGDTCVECYGCECGAVETTTKIERLRWKIADLLNRLPGQCWADLVPWALYGPRSERFMGRSVLPWRPDTGTCRSDRDRTGSCYCGKFRVPDEPGEVSP